MFSEQFDHKKVKWFKGFKDLPTAYYPLKVPGVTTVLDLIPDPEWDQFVKEVGEEKALQIRKSAENRGSSMHCFIENFITELAKSKDPSKALKHTLSVSQKILIDEEKIPIEKVEQGREMFFNFYYSNYSNNYINLIGVELPIYSPILFYRGKVDVFYNEKGVGRVVADFKTTSSFIKSGSIKELKYKRQLGAYALAIEHMLKDQNVKINKASILAISTKSAVIQEIYCQNEELEEQKKEFETLVKEWHKINNQSFLFNN